MKRKARKRKEQSFPDEKRRKRIIAILQTAGMPIVFSDYYKGKQGREWTGSELRISQEFPTQMLMHEFGHWLDAKMLGTVTRVDFGIGEDGDRKVRTALGDFTPRNWIIGRACWKSMRVACSTP